MAVPLTVLQCCLTSSWGGLESVPAELAVALGRHGIRSLGLCRRGAPLERVFAARQVPQLAVAVRDYWAPRGVARIHGFLRNESVGVLHAHRGTDLWLLRPALFGLRPAPHLVWTSHILFRRTRKRDPLHRWLYRGVDRVIALTATSRRYLLACLPIRPEQVVVIPNGIDLGVFPAGPARETARAAARAALGAAASTPVLGLVGRLDPKKGQREAVVALAQVRARFPDVRLVLVGAETVGEPGEERHLRAVSAELGVADAVIFLGARADVPALLPGFDVLLVPSYSETFGLVVLEGMAAGVPVIATDAGGPPEILDEGRAGVLVPPRDSEALATAILALLANPDRRAALVATAYDRVRAHYALDAVVARTVALYHELVDGAKLGARLHDAPPGR